MSELSEKIRRQSEIVLILAKVARIVLYVAFGFTLYLLVSTWIPGETPLLRIGGMDVYLTVPQSVLLGDVLGVDLSRELSALRLDLGAQLLSFVLAQVMLRLVTRLFTHIRESETPFTPAAVKQLKTLAVLLGLIIGVQNTLVGVVVCLAVFAFALIFQYGGELQTHQPLRIRLAEKLGRLVEHRGKDRRAA